MRPHRVMMRLQREMMRLHEQFSNALLWRVRCDAEYVVIPNAAAIGHDAAAGRDDAVMLSAL